MAKLSREARKAIAETRLLRLLDTVTIANQRTIAQKIADAGPYGQRVDPHILTEVRKRMMAEGIITTVNAAHAPWFYASNSEPDLRKTRLSDLLSVYEPYIKIGNLIGQALEIATFRALSKLPTADFSGRFKDLDHHDDSTLYQKEEPQQHIGVRSIPGGERLDFLLRTNSAGPLGIECKNVRHWMYPHVSEIRELLRKCIALDAIPVLIARRIPYVTFTLLNRCGVIVHQTYNQLLPAAHTALANRVRDKTLLGYHDVRTGNEPDARLMKFITVNLLQVAPEARAKFDEYKDLLQAFASGEKGYPEFAGRVLRRSRGENEDGPAQEDSGPHWFDDPPDV